MSVLDSRAVRVGLLVAGFASVSSGAALAVFRHVMEDPLLFAASLACTVGGGFTVGTLLGGVLESGLPSDVVPVAHKLSTALTDLPTARVRVVCTSDLYLHEYANMELLFDADRRCFMYYDSVKGFLQDVIDRSCLMHLLVHNKLYMRDSPNSGKVLLSIEEDTLSVLGGMPVVRVEFDEMYDGFHDMHAVGVDVEHECFGVWNGTDWIESLLVTDNALPPPEVPAQAVNRAEC